MLLGYNIDFCETPSNLARVIVKASVVDLTEVPCFIVCVQKVKILRVDLGLVSVKSFRPLFWGEDRLMRMTHQMGLMTYSQISLSSLDLANLV